MNRTLGLFLLFGDDVLMANAGCFFQLFSCFLQNSIRIPFDQ